MNRAVPVGFRLMRDAIILFLLVMVSTYMLSGMFARYTASGSGGDGARTARWNVSVTFPSVEKLKMIGDGKYDEYLPFSVDPSGCEVASKVGLTVTLTQNGEVITWPAGVTAKITDADGENETVSDNGVFESFDSYAAGAEAKNYRLYLSSSEVENVTEYGMEIAARVEQTD